MKSTYSEELDVLGGYCLNEVAVACARGNKPGDSLEIGPPAALILFESAPLEGASEAGLFFAGVVARLFSCSCIA